MRCVFLCLFILFVHVSGAGAVERFAREKGIELDECCQVVARAKGRIRKAGNVRARDFLKLLPGVTISQHGAYSEFGDKELYVGASISTSSIFDIADRARARKVLKRKALRQVQATGFIIKKLILKKYLMLERVWKFRQMRGSMDSPVDIAGIDEKIDALELSLQEIDIDIEKFYAEIEYMCVEVEG